MNVKLFLVAFLCFICHHVYSGNKVDSLSLEEYNPVKTGRINFKILTLLDDSIVDYLYAWKYCNEQKKGELLTMDNPKTALFFYGNKGRYGLLIYRSYKKAKK